MNVYSIQFISICTLHSYSRHLYQYTSSPCSDMLSVPENSSASRINLCSVSINVSPWTLSERLCPVCDINHNPFPLIPLTSPFPSFWSKERMKGKEEWSWFDLIESSSWTMSPGTVIKSCSHQKQIPSLLLSLSIRSITSLLLFHPDPFNLLFTTLFILSIYLIFENEYYFRVYTRNQMRDSNYKLLTLHFLEKRWESGKERECTEGEKIKNVQMNVVVRKIGWRWIGVQCFYAPNPCITLLSHPLLFTSVLLAAWLRAR